MSRQYIYTQMDNNHNRKQSSRRMPAIPRRSTRLQSDGSKHIMVPPTGPMPHLFRGSPAQLNDLCAELGSPHHVPLPDSPQEGSYPTNLSINSDPGHLTAVHPAFRHITTRPGCRSYHRQSLQDRFLPISMVPSAPGQSSTYYTGAISHTSFVDESPSIHSAPAMGHAHFRHGKGSSHRTTLPSGTQGLSQTELDSLPWEAIADDYLRRQNKRNHKVLRPVPAPDQDPDDDDSSNSDEESQHIPTAPSASYNPFLPCYRPTPPTDIELGTFLRGLRIPSLLCHPHAHPVAWFYSSTGVLLGPYGGQYSQLGKALTKLSILDAHHFFAWYNSLRSALNSTGFHMDLLPQAVDLLYDADLRETPIDGDLLSSLHILFGPKFSIAATAEHFDSEHQRFSNTLYAVLSSPDVLPLNHGDKAKDILDKHSPKGDGFGVLQDLMLLFHPGLRDNFAPGFAQHTASAPQYTISGNQTVLDALTKYNTNYTRWLELLYLYPEHSTFRPVDIPLHYLQGLGSKAHYLQEELFALRSLKSDDLRLYSTHRKARAVPLRLQVEGLYSKLKSLLQYLPTPRTHRSTNAIHLGNHSSTHTQVLIPAIDVEHTLECALAGSLSLDPTQHPIHSLIVSAIQRARSANPHGACQYSWCGVKHDPLCCCICFGTNHKTPDCWHLNGLSDTRKELLVKAKTAQAAQLPPFDSTPSTLRASRQYLQTTSSPSRALHVNAISSTTHEESHAPLVDSLLDEVRSTSAADFASSLEPTPHVYSWDHTGHTSTIPSVYHTGMVAVLDPSCIAMTPNPEPNPTYSHHDPTEIQHSAPSSLPPPQLLLLLNMLPSFKMVRLSCMLILEQMEM